VAWFIYGVYVNILYYNSLKLLAGEIVSEMENLGPREVDIPTVLVYSIAIIVYCGAVRYITRTNSVDIMLLYS